MEVIVVKNYDEMSEKAYEIIKNIILDKNDACLGLATGSTPVGTYERLIAAYKRGELDFSNVRSYNLDEYLGIDFDHPESYHAFMNRNLFDHINIKKENTHVPGSDLEAQAECARYTEILSKDARDVQILGIGSNGHIAFNEPGTPFDSHVHVVDLAESTIKDNARFFDSIEDVPTQAMTMGIKDILDAKKIILLASGANKADAVYGLVKGEVTESLPASALQNHADVVVICDEAAASRL